MKAFRKAFSVPVFDVEVAIIVTSDIPGAYFDEFEEKIEDTMMACVGFKGRKFGLFLEPQAKSRPEVLAHEIFHLTHRILEFDEMNFDADHHEVGAYLCEYLTKEVNRRLKD